METMFAPNEWIIHVLNFFTSFAKFAFITMVITIILMIIKDQINSPKKVVPNKKYKHKSNQRHQRKKNENEIYQPNPFIKGITDIPEKLDTNYHALHIVIRALLYPLYIIFNLCYYLFYLLLICPIAFILALFGLIKGETFEYLIVKNYIRKGNNSDNSYNDSSTNDNHSEFSGGDFGGGGADRDF